TTSGSFLANGHSLLHSAFSPTVLNSPLGFEVTFDDDVIVVRYRGVTTMPHGSTVTIKLALADPAALGGYATPEDVAEVQAAVDALESSQVTTFLGLSDTPSSFSGQGNKVVAVNPAGTALTFATVSGGGGGGGGAPEDAEYIVAS